MMARSWCSSNLATLFAPESQRVVREYLESIKGKGVASLLEHGRDVLGRAAAAASFRCR